MSAATFAEPVVTRLRAAALAGDARRAAVWDSMDPHQRAIVLRVACIDPLWHAFPWSDLSDDARQSIADTIRALVGLVQAFAFRVPA